MTDLEKQDILLDFIRSCAGAQDARILDFSRLSGGAVQENYGLQISLVGGSLPGEQRFVVRTDAPGSLSASLDRAQEFRVLQQAHGAGVHAPQPYWLCTDTSLIGAKFYVMQWAAGSASPRALVKADGLTDEQRQTLLYELGQDLARLHQVA